ncbi:MAG: type II secretion system protein [Cyanobacteria bacterium SIG30]|nr:type II secretion system protein [Cyanobacteria bacterium SIG30]
MTGGGASSRLKAFTLAEVLITLAIIGVVAALTIPSVVANYEKTQIETKLKKAFNVISNSSLMAIKDYGPITTWNLGEVDVQKSAQNFVDTYMIPYLKVAKNCKGSTSDDCSYGVFYLNGDKPSDEYNLTNENAARFILADGSIISVQVFGVYASVMVDINGHKKPNVFGKDVFLMRYQLVHNGVSTGNIRFPGSKDNSTSVKSSGNYHYCNKNADGKGCGRLILQNGWKIPTKEQFVDWGGDPKNYPW